MPIKITLTVYSCRECPHVSNTWEEHDDPFVDAPYPGNRFCNINSETRYSVSISNPDKIPEDCPLKRTRRRK